MGVLVYFCDVCVMGVCVVVSWCVICVCVGGCGVFVQCVFMWCVSGM